LSAAPILVAVDFSPDSVRALEWAVETAAALGAPVLVLHVAHDPNAAPGFYSETQREASTARIGEVAEKVTAEFVDQMRAAHPASRGFSELEARVVEGLPATRIIEVAKQVGARMIVMGSRGRTGLEHLLLGSKAERVIQLAPIPVTIVKAEPDTRGS